MLSLGFVEQASKNRCNVALGDAFYSDGVQYWFIFGLDVMSTTYSLIQHVSEPLNQF